MNSKNINETLISIENNLLKLESARNQVDRVSGQSEVLVNEVSALVREIQLLKSQLISQKDSLTIQVGNKISEFENNLTFSYNSFLKKSEAISKSHNESTNESVDELKKLQIEIDKTKLEISKLDFEKSFNQQLVLLRQNQQYLNEVKSENENSNSLYRDLLNKSKEDVLLQISALEKEQLEEITKQKNSLLNSSEIYYNKIHSMVLILDKRLKFQKLLFISLITILILGGIGILTIMKFKRII